MVVSLENCAWKVAQADATLLSCARYEINRREQMEEGMELPAGILQENDILVTSGAIEHN